MEAEKVKHRLQSQLCAVISLCPGWTVTGESCVGSLDVVDVTLEKNVDIVMF